MLNLEGFSMKGKAVEIVKNCLVVILILSLFLFSLETMGGSFKLLGKETVKSILEATSNPFVGLFIGLLATAILQSSSTITSMLVALVATEALTLEAAIPIVMGANIGTTVTSSMVALGHISDKSEFRKAFAASILHDFFNIFTVLLLFPLQLFTGFLSETSHVAGSWIAQQEVESQLFNTITSNLFPIKWLSSSLLAQVEGFPWLALVISMILLFISLKFFANFINKILIGTYKKRMNQIFFGSPIKSLAWGTVITSGVQSSSVTSSLIVPLVAKGKITLDNSFCFLMGANLGTTVTALIAAFSKSEAAISLSVAHVFINLIGILIFFPIPALRKIPLNLARKMGMATTKNRAIGFVYLIVTFFIVPFLLIFFNR